MNIAFTELGEREYTWWEKHDPRKFRRLVALCHAVLVDPFRGIGKPEPLKHELQGCWSRRIDGMHRLVYLIDGDRVLILSCRFHY